VTAADPPDAVVDAAGSALRRDGRAIGLIGHLRAVFGCPLGRFAGQTAIVLGLLLFWELGSGRIMPRVWASSPSAILAKLASWIGDGSLWPHFIATISAAGIGYVLGAIAGILAGLVLGLSARVEEITNPFVIALYSLPKVALAPFFVIFFGIGVESKIALVSVTVFFLLLYNTLDGIHDLDRGPSDAFRLMGGRRSEIVAMVVFPGIMPWIFSGLRIAVRYAFTAAVLGELIAGNEGIGFLIESSAGQFNSSGIFAGVFVLVICSVTATELLTRAERSILHWRT
jgi:NitT/TauT family transport system permease protein